MERKCGLFQFLHKVKSEGNKRDQKFGILVMYNGNVRTMAMFLWAFYVSFL